jgi:hypothetical protein
MMLTLLDGEAYSLRSAMVTVLGHLICSDGGGAGDRDRSTADGAAPLLRAKQVGPPARWCPHCPPRHPTPLEYVSN